MSFVVHVWEKPVPSTLQEAVSIFDRLPRTEGVFPALDELDRRLLERYADQIECRREPSALEGARPSLRECYENIGIWSDYVDEILPFLAATANKLGLVVFDPQLGTVYLPDGRILGRRLIPQPSDRVNARNVEPKLRQLLTSWMTGKGFKWQKTWDYFSGLRDFGCGRHKLGLTVQTRSGDAVSVNILIDSELDTVRRVINNALSPGENREYETLSGLMGLYLSVTRPNDAKRLLKDFGKALLITRMSELPDVAATIAEIFDNGLLQLLSEAESESSYWAMALAEYRGERVVPLQTDIRCKLVAGRLCDDAMWRELAASEKHRLEKEIRTCRAAPNAPGNDVQLEQSNRLLGTLTLLVEYLDKKFRP